MTPGLDTILSCAVDAARTAGQYALKNSHRRQERIETSKHDIKLKLDIECQQKATDVILSSFPDHSILGEEDEAEIGDRRSEIRDVPSRSPSTTQVLGLSPQPSDSPYTWIIDPIDGTVNFSHGLPRWCCSIAVRQGKRTVAGAVYVPTTDELFTATRDGAAQCNGRDIRVSDVSRLTDAMVMTGIDRNVEDGSEHFPIFTGITLSCQKARVMGCAAYDLCEVARGSADGYFESGIYIWDVAAAGLIVERAGGKSEIIGHQNTRGDLLYLSTNGHIHEALRHLIAGN